MESARPVTLPAVGRPFALGMLYNCYHDTMILSDAPWDKETLAKRLEIKPLYPGSCKLKYQVQDKFKEKASTLNLDSRMKLSLLSGLVNMEGSAKYLDDRLTSSRQDRVSFHATYKTSFQRLVNLAQHIDRPEILKSTRATHYVAGITYGVDVVLVFDKWHSEDTSIGAIIRALSGVEIGVSAPTKLKNELKNASLGFTFSFYGDIKLRSSPTKPEEAFEVLQSLNNDNSVPILIQLEPIKTLANVNKTFFWEISSGTTDYIESFFECFQSLKVTCNDLLNKSGCKFFPRMNADIKKLLNVIDQQMDHIRTRVQNLLPKIRCGRREERELRENLMVFDSSPVAFKNLERLLKAKCKQISAITKLCESLQECAKVVTAPGEFESFAFDAAFPHIVVYSVSTVSSAQYLDKCLLYIRDGPNENRAWRQLLKDEEDVALHASLSEKAEIFKAYYKSNIGASNSNCKFIIMESSAERNVPQPAKVTASIQVYKKSTLLYANFAPVAKPGALEKTYESDDHIDISWQASLRGSENVKYYEVEYEAQTANSTPRIVQTNGNSANVCIRNLLPGTRYKLRYRGCTDTGRGSWSNDAFAQTSSSWPALTYFIVMVVIAIVFVILSAPETKSTS